MSYHLEAKDVLQYLNELGYFNITAYQLKEFMTDLKKLMKHDEKELEQLENVSECYDEYDSKVQRPENSVIYVENEEYRCDCVKSPVGSTRDVFDALYNTDTVSSRAKKAKKENVIRVQIKRPTSQGSKSDFDENKFKTDFENLRLQPSTRQTSSGVDSTNPSVPSIPSTTRSCPNIPVDAKLKKNKNKLQKPKSCLIKPRPPPKPFKSDPVSLYHKYREEWKKIKFPGQEGHHNVRWAIREKLLSDRNSYCY